VVRPVVRALSGTGLRSRFAASEGDSVRGSPCGRPARLRFTSLRPRSFGSLRFLATAKRGAPSGGQTVFPSGGPPPSSAPSGGAPFASGFRFRFRWCSRSENPFAGWDNRDSSPLRPVSSAPVRARVLPRVFGSRPSAGTRGCGQTAKRVCHTPVPGRNAATGPLRDRPGVGGRGRGPGSGREAEGRRLVHRSAGDGGWCTHRRLRSDPDRRPGGAGLRRGPCRLEGACRRDRRRDHSPDERALRDRRFRGACRSGGAFGPRMLLRNRGGGGGPSPAASRGRAVSFPGKIGGKMDGGSCVSFPGRPCRRRGAQRKPRGSGPLHGLLPLVPLLSPRKILDRPTAKFYLYFGRVPAIELPERTGCRMSRSCGRAKTPSPYTGIRHVRAARRFFLTSGNRTAENELYD
jgi:hypothetical protein